MSLKKKTFKVLIAGGGTGGHLFPGLAIAEELSEQHHCDIRFVGSKQGIESRIIPNTPYYLYTIPISGLYRVGAKRKLITLAKLPFALLKSLFILVSFRPKLVIGIGGYASGPILALAVLLRKKTVIQEQNAYPGMTNRLLGKWVHLAFVPFAQTTEHFKHPVVVGNPIRKAITQAIDTPQPDLNQKITLSIVGGSQGAHILNKTMCAALPQLASLSNRLKIIHQTGKDDYQWVASQYARFDQLEVQISDFIEDMAQLFTQSHLMLCRAGSMINEIIAMGKAGILVPIAVSSGNHQLENGKTMANANAAVMIEERELNADRLFSVIQDLVKNPDKIVEMGRNAKSLYQGNSAEKIVASIHDHLKI